MPTENVKATRALVPEPDVPECDPNSKWVVRNARSDVTGKTHILIRFFTHDKKRASTIIPGGDRSDFEKIRRQLSSENARLPIARKDGVAFVELLMRSVPADTVEMTSRPGFRNGGSGFVMPTYRLGSAKQEVVWHATNDSVLVAPCGSLEDYNARVLQPALCSPYLTFAILVPLASALLDYYESRTGESLLTETAVFHFAADSSSGKSTLARIAQGVSGAPRTNVDYRFTERGLEEAAARRSGLGLVVDDTETAELDDAALFKRMKLFGHRYPAGESRAMSRSGAAANFEPLRWKGFAISTGPDALSTIARRLKSPLQGDRVRFFDIPVPTAKQGGILSPTLPIAPNAVQPINPGDFIAAVEEGCGHNAGIMMRAWANVLIRQGDPAEIRRLCEEFVESVAEGEDGLEKRFAGKPGVVLAAGLIAKRHGLVSWPEQWIRDVVRFTYLLARAARDPEETQVRLKLHELQEALDDRRLFPKFVVTRGERPRLADGAVGLRMIVDGTAQYMLCTDRLATLVPDPAVAKRLLERLRIRGIVESSSNATNSVQLRVRVGADDKKLRFWKLRRKKLDNLLD